MKKLVFILLLFSGSIAFAQQGNKASEDLATEIAKQNAEHDSVMKYYDSLHKIRDSISMAADMQRNTNNLVNFMRERDEKARKRMWLRLGFGIAMLVILIIGLMRKRKKRI